MRFDALLRTQVDADGLVDYAGLKDAHAELDAYIRSLAAAPFEQLGRDEKLALLINAYNAFTLRLVLDHWPLASIRHIPGKRRWDAPRWRLAGETLSLNQIENERIRPRFKEPRIHFALVCAARGCPPLRAEAYTGARLSAQLADQARRVHSDGRWLRFASIRPPECCASPSCTNGTGPTSARPQAPSLSRWPATLPRCVPPSMPASASRSSGSPMTGH